MDWTEWCERRIDALPWYSLSRLGWRTWFAKLTPMGRRNVGLLALTGVASAALGVQFPVHLLFLWLLALHVATWVVSRVFRPRLAIVRRIPLRCAAGRPFRAVARVTNVGRLPAFDVGLVERARPPAVRHEGVATLASLVPGESADLEYALVVRRRGVYELKGPEVGSTFPLGIHRALRAHPARERLVVHPAFHPLERLDLPAGRRHQPGGVPLLSQVGDSEEFAGNREYRPGDSLRDIDHAAWARLGSPVVREHQQEYLARVALVVDTFRPTRGPAAARRIDAAISLGASIAEALGRTEHVVELFAAGPELYHFESGRSLAVLDDVLDVLACIEGCAKDPLAELAPRLLDRIGRVSACALVLVAWNEPRRALVRALAERGVRTKVVLVGEGGPVPTEDGVLRVTAADVERGIDAL